MGRGLNIFLTLLLLVTAATFFLILFEIPFFVEMANLLYIAGFLIIVGNSLFFIFGKHFTVYNTNYIGPAAAYPPFYGVVRWFFSPLLIFMALITILTLKFPDNSLAQSFPYLSFYTFPGVAILLAIGLITLFVLKGRRI